MRARKDDDPSQVSGPSDALDALPETDAFGDALAVLTSVSQRLAKLIAMVQDGGELPGDFANQVQSMAADLTTLAPTKDVEPNIGGPDAGTAGSLEKAMTTNANETVQIKKTELDAYTAMKVTLDAASSRMYGAQDLLRAGKADEALAELDAIGAMIKAVGAAAGSGEAAPTPGTEKAMKKVSFTPAQFNAYGLKQIELAKAEGAEKAQPRLEHLSKQLVAIAKLSTNFEDAQNGKIEMWSLELLEAYADTNALGGTAEDLTSMQDQEKSEAAQGTPQDDTGNPKGTNFSSNGGGDAQGAQDTMKTLGDAVAALVRDFTANNVPKPGTPSAASNQGAEAFAKNDKGGEFTWPADLADSRLDEAPVRRTKTEKRDDVRERADKEREALSWGSDPK